MYRSAISIVHLKPTFCEIAPKRSDLQAHPLVWFIPVNSEELQGLFLTAECSGQLTSSLTLHERGQLESQPRPRVKLKITLQS